jgi:predicted ATPase
VLTTIAIESYRSLRDLRLPLEPLNVITGANGTGKSSLYRALRLLADCASGRVISSLAREGGLESVLWAGPEHLGAAVRSGRHPVQGTVRSGPISLQLDDAFPGSRLEVVETRGRFDLELRAHGLLRPLSAAELSDGTLRYLLLVAALLSPRPPSLMVLNEPETSLHADLIPALARLIARASAHTQIIVVTHARDLVAAVSATGAQTLSLVKEFGATTLEGVARLEQQAWNWGSR